jgi:general L-amino acid transport system substrate-binding protein
MRLHLLGLGLALSTILSAGLSPALAGPTLDAVKARGFLKCASSQGTVGFGAPDDKGYWRGLDVETCRAVAVAIFNDKDKVEFVPLSGQQRVPALQTGEIDILPRTFTWTLRRDANGLNFTTPNYYEFTGFMMPKSLGVTKVAFRPVRPLKSWQMTSPRSTILV